MLAIKFKRIGKKHQPSFRVVVLEKRSKLGGRFVDDLGWLNPRSREFDVNKERAEHWLKVGAQATASVHNLFVRAGFVQSKKIQVHQKKSKKAVEEKGTSQEIKQETGGAAQI